MFRRQAAESETKAANARTEETRRAWLIIARDWAKMAEREEIQGSRQGRSAGRRSPVTARSRS
jgi:hypothetical protein